MGQPALNLPCCLRCLSTPGLLCGGITGINYPSRFSDVSGCFLLWLSPMDTELQSSALNALLHQQLSRRFHTPDCGCIIIPVFMGLLDSYTEWLLVPLGLQPANSYCRTIQLLTIQTDLINPFLYPDTVAPCI